MQVKPTGYGYYNQYEKTAESPAAEEGEKATQTTVSTEKDNPTAQDLKDLLTEQEKAFLASLSNWNKEKEDTYSFHLYKDDAGKFQLQTSKPKDSSSQLTKRLVNASGQVEVRQVVAKASSEMVNLKMIAAVGNKEDAAVARAAIRRLERLIGRAQRKIRDLDDEDILRVRKAKAEKQRESKKAEEIKKELRERMAKRQMRERGYLLDKRADGRPCRSQSDPTNPSIQLDAATEAVIAAQAEAIASAEMTAESGGGDIGMEAGGEVASTGGADSGGTEGGGEAASSGGVDLAV